MSEVSLIKSSAIQAIADGLAATVAGSTTAAQAAQLAAEQARDTAITARNAAQAAQAAAELARDASALSAADSNTYKIASQAARDAAQTAQAAAELARNAAIAAQAAAELARDNSAASATASQASRLASEAARDAALAAQAAALASQNASAASATLAQDWATKTNGIVAATDFSSKEFAQGSQAATGGSSKNWAQQTGADVTGAAALSRSSKSWSQDDLRGATYGGSAKDWSLGASSPDGTTNKSSKSYATDAAASAAAAAASATTALNAILSGFLGGIAGASVPATAPVAGNFYRITSAGTSQSKTWAVDDRAIYNGTSGSWTQISGGVTDPFTLARRVNGLAAAGGANFLLKTAVNSPFKNTGVTIAADDQFGISFFVEVPTSATADIRTICGWSSSQASSHGIGGCMRIYMSANELIARMHNASGDSTRLTNISNFIPVYGGTTAYVHFDKLSGQFTVNGVEIAVTGTTTGGTPPAWTDALLGSFFNVSDTSYPFTGQLSRILLWNVQLTAADKADLYFRGGVPHARHQFANFTDTLNSTTNNGGFETAGGGGADLFAQWSDSPGASMTYTSETVDTHGGTRAWRLAYTGGGAASWNQDNSGTPGTLGKAFEVSFWAKAVAMTGAYTSPIAIKCGDNNAFYEGGALTVGAWVKKAVQVVWNNTTGFSFTRSLLGQTGTFDVIVDDVRIRRIGVFAWFSMDDGIGRVFHDTTSNKLHLLGMPSCFDHAIPLEESNYPQTALVANGELADSSGVIPTDCVLVDVIVKNTTANVISGFGLGMSSGERDLTYEMDIPANGLKVLTIKREDLSGLTIGISPFGRIYYSAAVWNSGSLNISIRYRRERDV